MIELDSLKFTVDTADLIKAVTEVGNLQKAVSQLNKPLAENAKISAKVAVENAKVAVAEEKVAKAKAQTAEAENKASTAKARAEKATDNLIKKTKEQTTVLERQQSIYEFMTAGYSKGQATVLAQAKAQGALADEIQRVGKVLADQRKLTGGDPFDKSISGLTSLRNAMLELKDEQRTFTAGVQMTSKQYKEFARDKLRIIEVSKAEGASLSELKQRLRDHGAEYVKLTTEVNRLTEAEKERERSQRTQANAIRAISAEDEKMESILRSLNLAETEHVTVSEKAARSIANYERNLRLAGITGEQAAVKLDKFRKSAMMAAQAEEKRKVDMLSRALAPQISDVVVSLASGMNPMTVLLQQGLQVRDLIGLSGVAVNDLQKAFRSAASDMVSSIKGTAVALGSLLIGGLQDAGRAVVNFGMSITGQEKLTKSWRNEILAMNGLMGETPSIVRKLDVAIKALGIATALSFTTIAASLVLLAKGFFDVIKQENDLARALALTGKSLGMSHQQAITLAKSMESLGINTSDAMKALTLMAKEGVFTAKEVQNVTKAATDLEKYGGVAIEETVKSFAKLKEKPVEALIELAKKTEGISAASINAVNELNKQGKAHEASSLAIQIQADVVQAQTARMKNDLSSLTLFAIELAKGIASVTDEIFNSIFRRTPDADLAKKLQQELSVVGKDSIRGKEIERQLVSLRRQSESRAVAADLTNQQNAAQNALNNALSRAIGLEETLKTNAQKRTEETLKANKDYDLLISKGLRTEQDRLKALQAINDKYKDPKTPKSDADKAAEKEWSDFKSRTLDIFRQDMDDTKAVVKEYEDMIKSFEDDMLDSMSNRNAFRKEFDLNIENQFKTVQEETDLLQFQLSILGKTTEEQKKALKYRELSLAMEKEFADLDKAFGEFDPEYVAKKKLEIAQVYKQKLANFERGIDIETITQYQEKFVDAIETALFEGGKAGSNKLRDIIEAELRKPITVFIRAIVGDIFGGNTSGAVSKIEKSFNSLMNLGSSSAGSIGTSALRLGDWLSTSGNNSLASIGEFLQGNAGSIGKFGGAFSSAMTGNALYGGISNGYSISKGADIIGNVASLFGPMYGAIGGLVNRAFGRKLKDTGIQGSFSGQDGFSGSNYQFYKGGWFRSDKTKTSMIDPAVSAALKNQYGLIRASVLSLGEAIGTGSDFLDNFTKSFKISFSGLSEDQIDQKLTELFSDMSSEMADMVQGLGDFKRQGETSIQTLTRLSDSLSGVNTLLRMLGGNQYGTSLSGADLASQLADLFGGLSSMQSAVGTYFENFYSQEEQLLARTKEVTRVFDSFGITLPDTVEEYKSLVSAQDLNTEGGRELYAQLIQLSAAFYEIKSASQEAGSALVEEINRLRGVVQTSSVNGFEGTKASFLSAISAAGSGDANAMASLPGLSQSLETMFSGSASSLEDVNRFRSWLANSIGSVVPSFASGGIHAGGVRLVGENGPELEVTGPSRIFSAGETAGMLGGNNVVQAIAVLNQNLELLRAEVRADVQHNAKTAKLLDRVIPEGDSIKVSNL